MPLLHPGLQTPVPDRTGGEARSPVPVPLETTWQKFLTQWRPPPPPPRRAIQDHHRPMLSSRIRGEHVLLLLGEHVHVPGLGGGATTAFGRVFLFCLHRRVLFLGRSRRPFNSQCACAHSQPCSAQVQTGHGQLSNDGNLARRSTTTTTRCGSAAAQ